MNAPDQITTLLIEQLIPSPTNPRKRFDPVKLQELADSIKAHGVLQPILVREQPFEEGKPRRAEIISGERRYRAAKLAGIDMVPVMIRNLTDTEVLHAQVIENLQRDDLHELEEAEGYERLLQEKDRNGQPYTAETIAAEIGKSRAYVYARLKLLDLCQEAREACYAGEIDASTALLIARIPVHKLQVEALKEVTRTEDNPHLPTRCQGDKVISYRKARAILQDRYMLDLADAPFDIKDAALAPKAGSCTDCTKRTGNQPELFDDVASKDVCTDPVCHAMKKTAHVLALQKAAEEKGNKLLLGKDAKKLIPNYMKTPEEHLKDHGYVPLDAKVPGDEQNRTFGQILKEAKLLTPAKDGKAAVSKTIIEHPHRANTMIETVSIEAATKALREAGFEITMKSQEEARQKDDEKRAKEREKEKHELAIENAFRSRLFDTLHAQIEADMLDPNSATFPKLYKRMAKELMDTYEPSGEDMQILVQKYITPVKQEGDAETDWEATFELFDNELPNFTPAQHLMLIVELTLIVNELFANQWSREAKTMRALAEDLGIDADGMRMEVADEVKAEQKAKAAAAKKTEKPKPKKAEPEAAPATAPKVRPAATWPFPTPSNAN
jgi:ParB/RepB/Spo0J family partition protein